MPTMMREPFRRTVCALTMGILMTVLAASACSTEEVAAPAVATPSLTLNTERAPAGSPLELTYKFVVADNATFSEDFRVFVHVVDTDEERMWD